MYDKQYSGLTHRPQRDPSLFFIGRFIALGQGVRIIEYKSSSLKADMMLQQVPLVLCFVPFKTHGRYPGRCFEDIQGYEVCQYMCTYSMIRAPGASPTVIGYT